jgi:hypothetical protein
MRCVRRLLAIGLAAALAVPLAAQAPRTLSDSAFAQLVAALSEPAGYFDTDNLISNEDSYLHPVGTLKRIGVSGGAYLGVGPDQNFSYIAAVQPHVAFVIDIRRDNMLEQLLFKALFALSHDRIEYLALLFGKPLPADTTGWGARTIEELLQYIDRTHADSATTARVRARVLNQVRRSAIPLSAADAQTIDRFYRTFVAQGPGLRFSSFNRAPQPYYPDYRRLLVETDRTGRQSNYLAHEADFQIVKALEDHNLVVPVVGDFGGDKALLAIAKWLRSHGETVSMFYTSNVEQYLFREEVFTRFAGCVAQLPRDDKTVMVRSYFMGGHPQAVAGYHAVQIVQMMDRFVGLQSAGELGSYYEVVTRDLVRP